MGCSVTASEDDEDIRVAFPAHAELIAEAQGHVAGLNIECGLHFLIDRLDEEEPGTNEVLGVMGGDIQRQVLPDDEQQNGVLFWGDAFDTVRIAFPHPAEIIVSSILHEPGGESRFWDELLRFEGMTSAEKQWTGSWQCAPLDTREDTLGIIEGTWTIEPIE